MSKSMRGVAQCHIPFGAKVLCRDFRVTLAGDEIANGTARPLPTWARRPRYDKGDMVNVDPVVGLGGRDLHAMANAPLMDANRLFLPAGKLSMEEYRARVAADVSSPSPAPAGERL
jgi:hypothetical protein